MKAKTRIILTSSLAVLGITCIGSGTYLQLNPVKANNYELEVMNTDIPIEQKLIITPKEIIIKINDTLSTNIQDYIEEPVENSILAKLKLDISKVNTQEAGSYPYSISYKKQTFAGTIIVKEEKIEQPKITLKEIALKLGDPLSKDITTYVVETLTEEAKKQMKLDLSGVNINKAGSYQYSITYNDMYYTGKITIVADQPVISSPKQEQEEDKDINTTLEKEPNNTTKDKTTADNNNPTNNSQ